MRAMVLALAGLLLAGCYESNQMLLNPGMAAQPIKTAADWKYQSDGDTYHAKLRPRSDGWYEFEEAQVNSDGSEGTPDHHALLLNYLERADTNDVYVFGTWNERESTFMYGIAVIRPDHTWRLLIPNCDSFTARGGWASVDVDAAVKAAAQTPRGQYGCFFTSDQSLRRAMRNLVETKTFWQRLDGASNG